MLARLLPADVHETLGGDVHARLDAWIAENPRRVGTLMRADADAFVAALRADGTTSSLRPPALLAEILVPAGIESRRLRLCESNARKDGPPP